MVAFRVIGTPTPRAEGVDKVNGDAHYAADQVLPGTLWGKMLFSPYSHARIISIDTTEARKLPGVHAVLTGADLSGHIYGRAIRDMPVLADGKVRYFGERVAAVAAEDKDTAEQALDLIEVEYEELPSVFDLEEALSESAPVLHPDYRTYPGARPVDKVTNRYFSSVTDRGDVDQGFAEADVIVENTYRVPRVHQAYLEPHSSLVSVQGDRVEVWCTTKAPYNIRDSLAAAIDLPAESIILNHSYIGGDFGGKGTPLDLPIAYFLAKATGRPVRIVADYIEEFMAGNPRHSAMVELKTGVKRDGTLTAHHVKFYVNCGAYAAYKPGGVIGGANSAAGPYRVPNSRIESIQVYTNTVPGGHMRAPGLPQALFALESHIDEVARRLAMDPADFRLQNLIGDGEETASGQRLNDVRVKETLAAAVDAAGYRAPKAANVGRGVAVGDHAPGGGQGYAAVTLTPDGSVTLGTPIFDQGSGTYTTLLQVVAEELQVEPEDIGLDIWNTGVIPFDSGIGGSRATRVATSAAHAAAQDAKQALLSLAAERLGWPEDRLILRGKEIVRTDQEEVITWPELLSGAGTAVTGHGDIEERGASPVTSFAAQIAEVAVDPETGEIKLLKFTTAHDVGRVVNPLGHQGQINGGLMQGLGYALMEELRVEDGRVTSLSFGDYKIPTINDIPELNTVLLESDSGVGPYLIKGIGENSIGPVAPAIANAIEDAVGVRIRDLPLTAEKVYRALKAKAGA